MHLHGLNTVIYGATNELGGTVARWFAGEGAVVFLAGRSRDPLSSLAREIAAEGHEAYASTVDPLDEASVDRHLTYVVNEHGSVDVSFNLAFASLRAGTRLTGLSDEEFAAVAFTRPRSNFITGIAAARKMAYQGRGAVLGVSGPERGAGPAAVDGFAIGGALIERMFDQLHREVGPHGVLVACLRSPTGQGRPILDELPGLLPVRRSPRPEGPRERADYTGTARSDALLGAECPSTA